eukprot:402785-Pleurochrysis_carterae.AAC.1
MGRGGKEKQKQKEKAENSAREALRNRYRQHCCVAPHASREYFTEKWEVGRGSKLRQGEVKETCSSLGLHHDFRHPSCAVHMNNFCTTGSNLQTDSRCSAHCLRTRGCTDHALFSYCSSAQGASDASCTCINYTPAAGSPEEMLLQKLNGSNNGCW